MSMFTKRGAAAVTSATAEKETKSSVLVPFGSGTTYKVRVKSAENVVEYFGYGLFGKVTTFVPKNPAERNDRGFVTANPTAWDKAAQLLYDEAKALKDAGDTVGAEQISKQAYLYAGKRKYLIALGNLENGEDIVLDLTANQAKGVQATIAKYAKKLDKLAFEITKSGSSTSTVVSLSPILDMDEDLSEAERKNFDKCGEKPFDFAQFETCLFVADEAEQIRNLVIAGFDIARLGLSIGATNADDAKPIDDSDAPPEVNF